MDSNFLRFGIAGLRGTVGNALNPQIVTDYVCALGTYLSTGAVVVGSDTRFSSPYLKRAVMSSLLSCGCDVLDAGIAPAPLVHFLVPHHQAIGGVLIGAGHHLGDRNAVVPLGENGAYFNSVQTNCLLSMYHSRYAEKASYDRIGKVYAVDDRCIEHYLATLRKHLDIKSIRRGKFKIVMDFCNGSGSILGKQFAKMLGLEMIAINDELSGYLPHEPEPRPRSGKQVKALMTPLHADVGFVLNSDASRVSIITNTGETPSEEITYAIVAEHVLSNCQKPTTIVTNVRTTRMIEDIADKYQATVEKTGIGQALILERMQEVKGKLGGDGSGSVVFDNGINGYDSFMIIASILEAMAKKGVTSSRLVDCLPPYHITKKYLYYRSTPHHLDRILKPHFQDAKSCDDVDGLRFDWDEGWVHVRVALTEPILRIIAEWKHKQGAEQIVSRMLAIAERNIQRA